MTQSLDQAAQSFQALIQATQCTDHEGASVETDAAIQRACDMLSDLRQRGGRLYVIGNGGSAAVAAHIVNDFVNMAGIRAQVLHDPSLLTCMTNDYGYENAYARILQTHAEAGDCLIGISSSGKSPNIRNAARLMRERDATVITLSGFKTDNPLRSLGDLNLWLDAAHYGFVEIGHLFLLHHMADALKR